MQEEALRILDHKAPVTALAFSPDGLSLASGDTERQVTVRNAEGSVRKWSFQSFGAKVRATERMRALAFSPDGRYLFVSARDAIESLWTDTGTQAWRYQPPRHFGFLVVSPLRFAISKTGLIASAFDNGTVGVWSTAGNRYRVWHEPESPSWVGWLQDGVHLAGADSFHVQVWDWRLKMRVSRWTPGDRIINFIVHPTEDTAAIRTLHEVQLVDLANEKLLAVFPAPQGLPLLSFRPGHLELAVCGLGYAMVYSYGGEERARFDLRGKRPTSLTWMQDGSAIAIGCADGSVEVSAMSRAGTELSEVYSPGA